MNDYRKRKDKAIRRIRSARDEATLDRWHMLDHQRDTAAAALRKVADPEAVAIVWDCRGRCGRDVWKASLIKEGRTEGQAEEKMAADTIRRQQAGQYPTLVSVFGYSQARELLAATSPTAKESLSNARRLAEATGPLSRVVVGVGQDGNTYSLVQLG